ncbi:MAG: diacylglycerol kinase family protein, partial [Bdellovibrionota bacterium]
VHLTATTDEFRTHLQASAKDGFDLIGIVGGDGSLHLAINSLSEMIFAQQARKLTLAVIPGGTGSDYSRNIYPHGIPKDWNLFFQQGQDRLVDVGLIDVLEPNPRKILFINALGLCLNAEVVKGKNSLPKFLPSRLRYLLPTLSQIVSFKPVPMVVTTEDEKISLKLLSGIISKGQFAGGGMKVGPHAVLSDGQFEMTLIERPPISRVASNLPKLYNGNLGEVPGIHQFKCAKLTITSQEAFEAEADGDLIGLIKTAHISVIPEAIMVRFLSFTH